MSEYTQPLTFCIHLPAIIFFFYFCFFECVSLSSLIPETVSLPLSLSLSLSLHLSPSSLSLSLLLFVLNEESMGE